MAIQGLDLAWIVVKDLKEAVRFYTETVGMELKELNEVFGWAELAAKNGGTRLGIAVQNDREAIRAGQNAVVALSVQNIEQYTEEMKQKGAEVVGELVEIPGVVKLQMIKDPSGNHFQIVESSS